MLSRPARHILAPLALLLGLAGPASAAETPPIEDPGTEAQHYVDAVIRHDFDGLVARVCAGRSDCTTNKTLSDGFAQMKGHTYIGLRKAIDIGFPEAIRQIYYSGRIDGNRPFHLRLTFRMTDAGWRYSDLRHAIGGWSEPFPNDLVEGSLIGLTGASSHGRPETTVDMLSAKIIAGIASRNSDEAAEAVKRNIVDPSDNMSHTIDGIFATLRPYEISHIRKIIDKEIDNRIRQQFYYAVVNGENALYFRLTYMRGAKDWQITDLQFNGDNAFIIPPVLLKNSLAALPLPQ